MDHNLKEIPHVQAYQRFNSYDWQEINKVDRWYKEKYQEYPIVMFYQYKNNAGLVAIYEHNDVEVLSIQLIADITPLMDTRRGDYDK